MTRFRRRVVVLPRIGLFTPRLDVNCADQLAPFLNFLRNEPSDFVGVPVHGAVPGSANRPLIMTSANPVLIS
jgi:hypothetical protein